MANPFQQIRLRREEKRQQMILGFDNLIDQATTILNWVERYRGALEEVKNTLEIEDEDDRERAEIAIGEDLRKEASELLERFPKMELETAFEALDVLASGSKRISFLNALTKMTLGETLTGKMKD